MHIKNLSIKQFRNIKELQLPLEKSVHLFLGENGQGKTNLIEAIYYSLKGESFRPAKVDHLKMEDESFMKLDLDLLKKGLLYKNSLSLVDKKRKLTSNGKPCSASSLSKNFPVVVFSPESLSSIKSGPDARRGLIDESLTLLFPEELKTLNEFKKSLRSRNRLLKQIKLEGDLNHEKSRVLESLNQIFFPLAAKVAALRLKTLKTLVVSMNKSYKKITGLENVDISVDYVISAQSAIDWDLKRVYDSLLERCQSLRGAEVATGTSLIGPHKHEIRFLMAGEDSRYLSSQGQQRALILSYKMAEIEQYEAFYNESPLLLLDDVLSELDQEKRIRFLKYLGQLRTQIFLTTTDFDCPKSFQWDNVTSYQVRQGQVQVLPNL